MIEKNGKKKINSSSLDDELKDIPCYSCSDITTGKCKNSLSCPKLKKQRESDLKSAFMGDKRKWVTYDGKRRGPEQDDEDQEDTRYDLDEGENIEGPSYKTPLAKKQIEPYDREILKKRVDESEIFKPFEKKERAYFDSFIDCDKINKIAKRAGRIYQDMHKSIQRRLDKLAKSIDREKWNNGKRRTPHQLKIDLRLHLGDLK